MEIWEVTRAVNTGRSGIVSLTEKYRGQQIIRRMHRNTIRTRTSRRTVSGDHVRRIADERRFRKKKAKEPSNCKVTQQSITGMGDPNNVAHRRCSRREWLWAHRFWQHLEQISGMMSALAVRQRRLPLKCQRQRLCGHRKQYHGIWSHGWCGGFNSGSISDIYREGSDRMARRLSMRWCDRGTGGMSAASA